MHKTLILLLFCLNSAVAQTTAPVQELIREHCEAIQEGFDGSVAGDRVAAGELLATFYGRRGFRPAWQAAGRLEALLQVLQDARTHGLDPGDYHYATLLRLASAADGPGTTAERDILATDALIRYGYHLHFGKVDPASLDPDWNLVRRLRDREPVAVLEEAVAAPSLAGFLERELAPDVAIYRSLQQALARYRDIAAAGGWPAVPAGPTIAPGDSGARVAALRARLAVTDSAPHVAAVGPARYDAPLLAAVERFQRRHGLEVDGLVGPATLEALNVPVESRIDQLRVNLERTRWVFRDLDERYLIVNIAGFYLYLMEHGRIAWNTRVVVGTPYRKTPVFKAKLTYLVLNPTWTVPPTILRQDIIPAMQRDPDYLSKQNMVLLDLSGRLVETAAVDPQEFSADHFPYVVRQQPGPRNALGRIKFMFPNSHFVYLHDTPGRELFGRASRTFSSGCIRVEQPLTLAEKLLEDPVNWNDATLRRYLDRGTTQTVTLPDPISVFLMYWTAEPDDDGVVRFFNDVYGRDRAVLDGLREPFAWLPLVGQFGAAAASTGSR